MPPTTVSQATLELPFRTPPLSMNDRRNRHAEASIVASVKEAVHWLALKHRLPKGIPHVTVQLHYRPIDNRDRDTDNLAATLKPACDALTAGTRTHPGYGMVRKDTPAFMAKPEPIIHPAEKGRPGRLWLELTWDAA